MLQLDVPTAGCDYGAIDPPVSKATGTAGPLHSSGIAADHEGVLFFSRDLSVFQRF